MFDAINIDMQILNAELYETKDLTSNVPKFATEGSVAIDLRANSVDDITLQVGETVLIGTGLKVDMTSHVCTYTDEDQNYHEFALPNGLALCSKVLPRSGLGHKYGIVMGNGTGLIDTDYQGEMKMSIWNRSKEEYVIKAGSRVAQLMFVLAVKPTFNIVTEFKETTGRGENGFGHTGMK